MNYDIEFDDSLELLTYKFKNCWSCDGKSELINILEKISDRLDKIEEKLNGDLI